MLGCPLYILHCHPLTHLLFGHTRLFNITIRQISNSPDVEQGGKGGHVEGELGVAPVQHVLGHHGDQEDPFEQSVRHKTTRRRFSGPPT